MADTINSMFAASVAAFADRPALAHKPGDAYRSITYRELFDRVRCFASGLAALGVNAGDRLALVSENRPEWAVADLAMLSLGAVNVPMFPTLPAPQIEYILRDSQAKVVIVSNASQLAKACAVQPNLPGLKVIVMDCPADPEGGVLCFDEVMTLGSERPLSAAEFQARTEAVRPEDLASIVYTSGTTGEPKGVMLTHGNFVANVTAALDALRFAPEDSLVSFLPLNHCLERTAGYYATLSCGSLVAYAQSLRRLRENIREVQPTYMILVPRVYEAIHQGLLDQIARSSPLRRRTCAWALAVGRERVRRVQAERHLPLGLRMQWWLARKLVHDRARAAVGFGRLKFLVSGGAPLAEDTAAFFHAAGMPILEGYGMTEASPVITFNHPDRWKLGTVGLPVTDVELRIGEGGEILCRGPNVMLGYHNRPADTAAVLDDEGWLHTGDVGQIDEQGFLRITDRLKDLIVLTNGKKIAPQAVESELSRSPFLAQVVVVGDGRATVGALIVPNFARVRDWAREQGLDLPEAEAALAASPELMKLIRGEVDRLSEGLADFERPHGLALLDRELTVENGELTPTLKVKRRTVVERHADLVEAICPRG